MSPRRHSAEAGGPPHIGGARRPRRLELALQPGVYVGRAKAQRLLAHGLGRLDAHGRLLLRPAAAGELLEGRVRWSERSRGFVMNGRSINRAG